MRAEGAPFQLIDVREKWEYEISHLGGTLIPKEEILERVAELARDVPVIIHCYKGGRSAEVVRLLEEQLQMGNLYNLKGGLLAYAEEIDPNLRTY